MLPVQTMYVGFKIFKAGLLPEMLFLLLVF